MSNNAILAISRVTLGLVTLTSFVLITQHLFK